MRRALCHNPEVRAETPLDHNEKIYLLLHLMLALEGPGHDELIAMPCSCNTPRLED